MGVHCPPLPYSLSMEHLATGLKNNPSIHGTSVGETTHKLALYSDDLVLYITDTLISLPASLQEFKTFSALSNFKVNLQKSECLM